MAGERHAVSLLTLPTELLYRICDFLDAETLLLSFRGVCTHFQAVADTYEQYDIRIPTDSNANLCRIIRPENIVSLNFWDQTQRTDWIADFLSRCDINRFTRLRSLSLSKIDRNELMIILRHVTINCQLSSLSICYDVSTDDDGDVLHCLFLAIAQPTLRQLGLHSNLADTNELSWPKHCPLRALTIGSCKIQQFCLILLNSPHLHTLIMNNCYVHAIDGISLSDSYRQLTSLTLNDLRMTMDKFELLLSFVPSLVRLDLSSSGKPFEFVQRLSRWEGFLRARLPRLLQLELCIFCYCCDWQNFEVLIDAFRTPFWLTEKRWFVTCQFRDDWTSSFTVFTSTQPPIQSSGNEHNFEQVVCSNSTACSV